MTSYITAADAQDYFDTRISTRAWDIASSTNRDKSLLHATRLIDSIRYIGQKDDSEQEHEFPRDGQTVVPQDVLDACCEIALALLDGVDPDFEYAQLKVVSQGYSSVRTTYDPDMIPEHVVAGIPSATAYKLLKPYILDPQEIGVDKI